MKIANVDIQSPIVIADLAVNGNAGTAAATVDTANGLSIPQVSGIRIANAIRLYDYTGIQALNDAVSCQNADSAFDTIDDYGLPYRSTTPTITTPATVVVGHAAPTQIILEAWIDCPVTAFTINIVAGAAVQTTGVYAGEDWTSAVQLRWNDCAGTGAGWAIDTTGYAQYAGKTYLFFRLYLNNGVGASSATLQWDIGAGLVNIPLANLRADPPAPIPNPLGATIAATLPNPTSVELGQRIMSANTGERNFGLQGVNLLPGEFTDFVRYTAGWARSVASFGVAPAIWTVRGNAGISLTGMGITTSNYLGPSDANKIVMKVNGDLAADQSGCELLLITAMTNVVTTPESIFRIVRGNAGLLPAQVAATWRLGTFAAALAPYTQLELFLSDEGTDVRVLSLFSNGSVGIGKDAVFVSASGSNAIGKGATGATQGQGKMAIDGADSSVAGPHVQFTTNDDYPVRQDFHYAHDNSSINFDSYRGAGNVWNASHTSRPFAIVKRNGAFSIVSSKVIPTAAGQVLTEDIGASFQYATATNIMELTFSNEFYNRRIVLFDNDPASDHDFYGFGIQNGELRYQAGINGEHVFYGATAATTSQEDMRINQTGVGIGVTTPQVKLDVDLAAGAGGAVVASLVRSSTIDPNFRVATTKGVLTNLPGDLLGRFGSVYGATPNANIQFYKGAAVGNSYMAFRVNNADRAWIDGTGNVMMATATPTAGSLLTVAGNGSKVGGGNWAVTSSRKFKKNIKPFKRGLQELLHILPVKFDRRDGSANGEVGIILEEARQPIPEIAKSQDVSDGGNALIWTMVNAVKEIAQRTKKLERIYS